MSDTKIRHLVISSGGPAGHMMYSILRTLNLKGVWDIKDIRTIYGSSVGSFGAILIALRYDWETMDDFLIKRPWDKIFMSSSSSSSSSSTSGATEDGTATDGCGGVSATISEATSKAAAYAFNAKNKLDYVFKLYNQHGVYGLKEFSEMLRPALQGKDMTVSITLQEFYQKTGIELHFIVTELNKFVTVDFSHKTHPTQSLVEACYMSCCYPFVFSPIYRDGGCYVDGGIINDYPVNECLREQKCDSSEILGIKMLWERKPANLTEKSSILQLISTFFNQIKGNLFENRPTRRVINEVVCVSKIFASQDWMNWAKDENYRRELMLRGETFANVFLSYRRNFRETKDTVVPTSTPAVESIASPIDRAPSPSPSPSSHIQIIDEIQTDIDCDAHTTIDILDILNNDQSSVE
jgi:predicted acylesterase/phospholipase RssA